MLKALDWQLNPPTAILFAHMYLPIVGDNVEALALKILCYIQKGYKFNIEYSMLEYRPSVQAMAAILYAHEHRKSFSVAIDRLQDDLTSMHTSYDAMVLDIPFPQLVS